MAFDGVKLEKLKEVTFVELKIFQRFFTDSGEGYSKSSASTCIDDYSFKPIHISPDTKVFIK